MDITVDTVKPFSGYASRGMKVYTLAVGAASLLLGAAAACSSFEEATPPGNEGGADVTDAAPDRALVPTPGKIACFGASCDKSQGLLCCVDPDTGASGCESKCRSLQTRTLACDEKSDCPDGQSCCVNGLGSQCGLNCADRFCHTDDECEKGTTCVAVPCRGTTIGACGLTPTSVKVFCDIR